MLIQSLALLLFTVPTVFADVKIISPKAAATLPAGSLTVTWQESGTQPLISSLAGYTLYLMAGGNNVANFQQIGTIAGNLATDKSKTITFLPSLGPNTANAYYIKIVSAPATGTGQIVNYSDRFSISGMTGAWTNPAAEADLKTVTGTAGPPTQNSIAGNDGSNNNNPAAGANNGAYGVAYSLQTGLTKYAPMQPKPGSKITAKVTGPMYPTSSYFIATTFLPPAKQVTTSTQAVTYSVSSRENTASPAPQPADDMQKFLARWAD